MTKPSFRWQRSFFASQSLDSCLMAMQPSNLASLHLFLNLFQVGKETSDKTAANISEIGLFIMPDQSADRLRCPQLQGLHVLYNPHLKSHKTVSRSRILRAFPFLVLLVDWSDTRYRIFVMIGFTWCYSVVTASMKILVEKFPRPS